MPRRSQALVIGIMPTDPYTNPTNTVLAMWLLVSVVFVGIGLYFRRTPASRILEWDQWAAYWVYEPELRASGDKEKALAKTATLYKTFGLMFVSISAIHVVCVATWLLYRLLASF